MLGLEQGAGPLDGQPLGNVHELAAAIVALARASLGVFVGQQRSLCGQDVGADIVLGGDQRRRVLLRRVLLSRLLLALALGGKHAKEDWVRFLGHVPSLGSIKV